MAALSPVELLNSDLPGGAIMNKMWEAVKASTAEAGKCAAWMPVPKLMEFLEVRATDLPKRLRCTDAQIEIELGQ